jgi:hypothetical protein
MLIGRMEKRKNKIWWPTRIIIKGVWALVLLAAGVVEAAGEGILRLWKKKVKKDTVNAGEQKEPLPAIYDKPLPQETTAGSYEAVEESILNRSQILLIFGRRGSGKSALGFRLLENIHAKAKRACFVLGVKQASLPEWIHEIAALEEVKDGGAVLVDEGAIEFGARESMRKKNVSLGKLLAIARHKDLTLILVTQNTGMIDKSVLNLTDIVMAKEGSLLQKEMERPVMHKLLEKVNAAMKDIPKDERMKHVYFFSDDFEGMCTVTLPSFWTDKISKSRA